MILAIWISCVCFILAHIFNDTLWACFLLTTIASFSFTMAQESYETFKKRIEELEREHLHTKRNAQKHTETHDNTPKERGGAK